MKKFTSIGIIKNKPQFDEEKLLFFDQDDKRIIKNSNWE